MWRRLILGGTCWCVAFGWGGMLPLANASATACPNELLRLELHSGQLPDCRAYELVTPAYKEGAYVSAVLAISQDGSHLLGSSLGAFAGTAGDGLGSGTSLVGATYEFSRTTEPEGWSALPLDPPRSRFGSNGLFDASADLGITLWELGRRAITAPGASPETLLCPAKEGEEELHLESVTDFYREEPHARTPFTKVGPATPEPCVPNGGEYTYIGGSADLSHILFSTQSGFRWPNDETIGTGSTLYEYVGTNNTSPTLVGENESGSLVSDCGTRLGSSTPNEVKGSSGSMYNAISMTGERIFFTAVGEDDQACGVTEPAVDELFVREEAHSPEASSQVHVTAISCREGLPSPCADANFEGASQDGSKVFFTSTGKLLAGADDDSTVGDSAVGVGLPPNEEKGCVRTAEGSSGCNLYEDALSSLGSVLTQKLVLVSGGNSNPRVQGVARISEDGSHVYFVAKGVLTGPNTEGVAPVSGEDNLYGFERDGQTAEEGFPEGRTSFIATLSPSDEDADWRRADQRPVQVSQDGSLLVFTSVGDPKHEGVLTGIRQVFQYDSQTHALVRVSIGEDGYANDNRNPANNATITAWPSGYIYANNDSPTQTDGVLAPQDGAVFFESADALTPAALHNGMDTLGQPVPNVYEYRAGHVYLISDGHDESTLHGGPGVILLGSDRGGENVFFETSDSLIGPDTDTQQDIYDARADGGIPTLSTLSPLACEAEGCRGLLRPTPALSVPGTAIQSAESSPPPIAASTMAKAKRKIKAKAIKKKVKRKRKRARGAGHQIRARAHGRSR